MRQIQTAANLLKSTKMLLISTNWKVIFVFVILVALFTRFTIVFFQIFQSKPWNYLHTVSIQVSKHVWKFSFFFLEQRHRFANPCPGANRFSKASKLNTHSKKIKVSGLYFALSLSLSLSLTLAVSLSLGCAHALLFSRSLWIISSCYVGVCVFF